MTPRPKLAGLIATAVVAALALGFVLGLWTGPQLRKPVPSETQAAVTFTATTFAVLNGWTRDPVVDALPALEASCKVFAARDPASVIGEGAIARSAKQWQAACAAVMQAPRDSAALRAAIESTFTPFAVNGPKGTVGTFTGYYETELAGSLTRTDRFKYPIYGVPHDLVTVDLETFIPNVPKTMPRQIVGRVADQQGRESLVPYFTRAQIDMENAVAATADVAAWADDPVAVHILHIQGSGRMTLPDDRRVRIGFAGHNGRQFRGVGSILIEAGVFKSGEASMDHVRDWLKAHPAEAVTYMNRNNRYIFFQLHPDGGEPGPVGALGIPLTPGRSLAVDPGFIPLGAPLWLETKDPDDVPLSRLVLAQDTGAAIAGPVRGDFFWGTGESAFNKAARMRSRGHYLVLIPRQ